MASFTPTQGCYPGVYSCLRDVTWLSPAATPSPLLDNSSLLTATGAVISNGYWPPDPTEVNNEYRRPA